MSTQKDIYAAGSENRPPMLNKENYVSWTSCLLRYAKSRPNGKLIHNSIINGPYVRRMIPELGDINREVPVNENFHVQTDDELTEKELKQIEADDQAIQTILLGLPKDIYSAIDSCKTAQEIWFTSNDGESIESCYHHFLKLMNDLKRNKHFPEKIASNLKFLNNLQPEWSRHVTIVHQTKDLHKADYTELYDFLKYNQNENYMQQPMPNHEDITDPTTAMNMALALIAKAFKLNYSTQTNNNQRISSNLRNRQISQPGMNMGQDRQIYMVGVQNPRVLNIRNQNRLIGVSGNANQNMNGNGNMVTACAEGNAAGHNGNQIRCYNCKGVGHFARNCTVRIRRRDAAYLQTQLLIVQKEEEGIQLQDKEFDLLAATADLDEIKEVNANCILMANLQQTSTSGTQTDKALVYDSDGSAKVHNYENCDDNEIFNMFTQEEQYIELLEPILKPHQVPQNDNSVIYEVFTIEVEKVNTVNCKLKETNAELTTDLTRFKNQEKCFEISQEKYDKLERCYQQSVYQEQCLSKKINALHLSFGKQILTLNEEISDLNKQLSKEKSTVSFLLEEKKKLKSDFKIHEDELLDKQIQLEKKIKELDNISVKTGQSIQTIHMLSPKSDSFYHTEQKMALGYQNLFYLKQAKKKQQSLYDEKVLLEKHDPPVVHDLEETLQLAQESRQKMKQSNKEITPANYTKINHLSGEIERLLRAVVSQDIMSVVQKAFVVDTSNLQTELERTKERFENRIIKKENEYAKLWNDWYKKCKECKFDKISYDKAYKDMQQKIKRLQAQLGDLKENAHLKTTYKNLFDSIFVSRTQTKTIIASLQNQLHNAIYENAKLRVELFNKVSDQKDNKSGMSANTKFAKQLTVGNLPKVDETHALSNPVTSNSVPTPRESKVVKNDKVIAPGMFRINPFKTSKKEKHVPNSVRASTGTKPITVLQPPVITKKVVNSDSNGLSSTGVDNTKTRRPHPRSNTKNDSVPSASKSSRSKNKGVKVEEHHRNLLFSKNTKHMSSACNNIKLDSQNVISKVVCAMCKQCLIFVNHDVIQICLWCIDSGCSKHMTGNLKLLINFVWKFMGTARFENDHVAVILGFGNLQWGNILITRVYFVEGLGHNLFLVGRFCDSDLEVAFRRNTCFVRNLERVNLLKGNRTTNLYTINLHDMASASPICLMARASSTKSWLWHQRLSHLNFDTINDLTKNDLVSGLSKFKYHKEHLCPSCEQGKSKRASHPPKPVPNLRQRNRTLVEAARTMLIFSHAPLFLWAETIATACFTQNRSIIHRRFNKTPYELINGRKPDISFLYVFGALCYPKNDREDIGKLGTKGLDLTYAPSTITTQQPTEGELDLLFEAMYDDFIGGQPSAAQRTVPAAQAQQVHQTSMISTSIADSVLTPTNSSS
nr:integrase, catalytic region, zinc finger, CCHC-type, peptidase aspartic, catalytic [Tanacetum cinerariifolium]